MALEQGLASDVQAADRLEAASCELERVAMVIAKSRTPGLAEDAFRDGERRIDMGK
jgi:hypothetical protein